MKKIHLMIYRFSLFFFLLIGQTLEAQVLSQMSAAWDESLDEWILYTTDEEVEGVLERKWKNGDNFSVWQYDIDQLGAGTISQSWEGNSNRWELLSDSGERIEFKTVWKDDYSIWEVRFEDKRLRLKSSSGQFRSEWSIQKSEEEEFHIYLANEPDPRDWLIEDYIEGGSMDLAIGIAFISMFHSVILRN